MIRVTDGGLPRYCFESFLGNALVHGVFTRLGGVSRGAFASLNVGHAVGDDPDDVRANHQAIYKALGVQPGNVVTAQQVHGDRVVIVSLENRLSEPNVPVIPPAPLAQAQARNLGLCSESEIPRPFGPRNDRHFHPLVVPPRGGMSSSSGIGGRTIARTDALVSNVPGVLLLMRFADCVPVFFHAPQQGAVGLAHAGWQGTIKRIAPKTAQAMLSAFGCSPGELYAGLGPAIGPCCFEVGPEVVQAFREACPLPDRVISRPQPDGKAYIDMWRANALQLEEVGVTHVEMADLCTCCHREVFYSHRGERGHTGRFAAAIGLRQVLAPDSPHSQVADLEGK